MDVRQVFGFALFICITTGNNDSNSAHPTIDQRLVDAPTSLPPYHTTIAQRLIDDPTSLPPYHPTIDQPLFYNNISTPTPPSPPMPVSNVELTRIASNIWENDWNSLTLNDYTIAEQGKIVQRNNKTDMADDRLFSYVNESVFARPTYAKFIDLLDNYNHAVGRAEVLNNSEIEAFIDEIMQTYVMNRTWHFLASKGYASTDESLFKLQLYEWWFTLYTRSKGLADSSGFEHVFVGELKNGKVTGFHNWIQFYLEERKGTLDYKGHFQYWSHNALKLQFSWMNKLKPISSIFIGSSPEFEMALLTLCFRVRKDKSCKFHHAGKEVNVVTYTVSQMPGLLHVGTAYPAI